MLCKLLFVVSFFISFLLFPHSAYGASTSRTVCSHTKRAGYARCTAEILTDGGGNIMPLVANNPQGYGPAVFKAAYADHGTTAGHIAIVGAYDAPNILSDLVTFSRTFGLPIPSQCTSTTQTNCLEKLNQTGGSKYPAKNSSWSVETSLDVESAHGMCPGCRISLVEAKSSAMNDLGQAVDTAVNTGASVISNSYGGIESSGEAQYDGHYHKPGVTMVVSSGDSGYGTDYPAASPWVVAVGGTHLQMNAAGTKVVSETVWQNAGSGCSQFEAKPSWQRDSRCPRRSIADVSADADPITGAAIYDSYPTHGHAGWLTVGGTSLAAPLVAGMLAASGQTSSQPAYLYTHIGVIRDIIGGSNGSCSYYYCKAITGYDGPSGLGVLQGI
jgi:subtilase family serine protease